jgi:DNA-binding LytR/AlgR family response regulator
VIAVLVFALAGENLAQEKTQAAPSGTVAQTDQQKVVVKTIFAYKQELGLTDKQEERLKKLLNDFQNYLTETRKELGQLQTELADLIRTKASLKSIKAQIEKITRIQGEVAYTDVETARNVEGVLTTSQLVKWNKIQEDFRKAAQAQAQKAPLETSKK